MKTFEPLAATVPFLRSGETPVELSLRAYENLDQLSALRPAWDELLSHYPPATTFSTWEWLSCWWECFGKSRRLLTLGLFDSGTLVGLAPLSISQERVGSFPLPLRVLRLMADGSGDSDNLDLPVRPGFERVFAEMMLQFLKQHRRQWDVCALETLPPDSLAAGCLIEMLRSSPWILFEHSTKFSAIPLPGDWDLYTQTLSSEHRNNLTRYTRRMQRRYSTRIYRCIAADELPACLEAMFRLHQERWQRAGEPGSFSSAARREFYAQLSRRLLDRGCLELWVLELDRKIAAVQFGFRHGEKVFQLQEGYDHRHSSDRPGFLLRGEVLKHLISENVRSYDFLGGEAPHKARWGAREGQYSQLHFALKLSTGGLCLRFVDRASKSKDWLRQRLSNSIWRALHRMNVAVHSGRSSPPSSPQ
jgi:CelD/BcsL family acetyltransferase involved in cellulose biosynthesis